MSTPDLPVGYSALEYVDVIREFTHDSVITTNAWDVELDIMPIQKSFEYNNFNLIRSTYRDGTYGYPLLICYQSFAFNGMRMINNSANREVLEGHPGNYTNQAYSGKVPDSLNKRMYYRIHDCGYTVDGTFYPFEPTEILTGINWGAMIVGAPISSKGNYVRFYKCTVRQNGVTTADLVPCTRESDGVPGLWCHVTKKFYAQN